MQMILGKNQKIFPPSLILIAGENVYIHLNPVFMFLKLQCVQI